MQGFNMGRYNPPASLDQSLSSSHTPGFNEGSRTKRGPGGAQTVRFEMPFAVWCTTCQPEAIIGQGIRFNAEKKKVGNYYSTPIWSFRMKHGACGGTIEIGTDPEKREYIVHEGGRRRETGVTLSNEGAFGEILTEEEREKRRTDAFAQLEGKKKETNVSRGENERVEELLQDRDKYWDDPYASNQRLRNGFRAGRKARAVSQKQKSSIASQYGLGVQLLDVTAEDAERAALIEFGNTVNTGMDDRSARYRPMFEPAAGSKGTKGDDGESQVRSSIRDRRTNLQTGLVGNTKSILDPFANLSPISPMNDLPRAIGVKRKRTITDSVDPPIKASTISAEAVDSLHSERVTEHSGSLLVAYSSDSD